MRFFSRLRTGLALARGSLSVLRDHPHLLWFPVVGGLAGLAFIGTFSRSGALVKDVWGESLGSEAGVCLVTVLLVLLGVGVTGLAFLLPTGTTAGFLVVLAIAAVAIVGALLIGETLSGIATTAVYVYATEGESPAYFSHVDFGK